MNYRDTNCPDCHALTSGDCGRHGSQMVVHLHDGGQTKHPVEQSESCLRCMTAQRDALREKLSDSDKLLLVARCNAENWSFGSDELMKRWAAERLLVERMARLVSCSNPRLELTNLHCNGLDKGDPSHPNRQHYHGCGSCIPCRVLADYEERRKQGW